MLMLSAFQAVNPVKNHKEAIKQFTTDYKKLKTLLVLDYPILKLNEYKQYSAKNRTNIRIKILMYYKKK
jgi:hypothetical protein